jgi:hypothetical protein
VYSTVKLRSDERGAGTRSNRWPAALDGGDPVEPVTGSSSAARVIGTRSSTYSGTSGITTSGTTSLPASARCTTGGAPAETGGSSSRAAARTGENGSTIQPSATTDTNSALASVARPRWVRRRRRERCSRRQRGSPATQSKPGAD